MIRVASPVEFANKAAMALFGALTLVVLCNPVHATERETFELQQNDRKWPITTVTINGQATPALLDTGATIALVDDDLLSFQVTGDDALETRVLGIGGQRLFPVTEIASLKAGAQSWYGLRVAVNTKDEFPVQQTILPTSMFQNSIIDFDFKNAKVELYNGYPKFVPDARRSAISYMAHEGLIFIPVRINGVRGKALIDTGASISFVNPRFAERARGVRLFEKEQDLKGSDLERNRVQIHRLRRLQFGENHVSKFDIPVLQTELFSTLGFGDEPMMVMGMDLLEHFRVQLDQKRERIVLLY